jgi:glycosyltransferase involved in cell wall biosynthesis
MSHPNGALKAITFVTPHQTPTSGGAYAIQQMAKHLAPEARVTLVTRQRPLRPIPGVEVRFVKRFGLSRLPRADAMVIYADCPDLDRFLRLPPEKGRKLLYLQGFGTPRKPLVYDNLRRGHPVIVCSTWLAAEASDLGAAATYVPHGIDEEIFHLPRGGARSSNRVVMMTQRKEGKGVDDGIEALRLVREQRPQTELILFGRRDVDLGARFLSRLSREDVAKLLRESTVFVCSSWEEGFGLPGLEALACGAALATTDTKGGRDYALDEETALVSPPRDPRRLADSILRLLGDPDLRARLADGAQRRLAKTYQSWPRSATRFREAIEEYIDKEPA